MNQIDQRASWLGVGRMGEAMAERLLVAGVGVEAWNRTPDKVAGLVARGATLLAAPALSGAPGAESTSQAGRTRPGWSSCAPTWSSRC